MSPILAQSKARSNTLQLSFDLKNRTSLDEPQMKIFASSFISAARKREQEQKRDDEVRALLTPMATVTMHTDATWEDEPVIQLMAKKVVDESGGNNHFLGSGWNNILVFGEKL